MLECVPRGYFMTTRAVSAAFPTNMKVRKKIWDIFSSGQFLAVLNQPYRKFNIMQYYLTVESKKEVKRHCYFEILVRVSTPRLTPVSARIPQA